MTLPYFTRVRPRFYREPAYEPPPSMLASFPIPSLVYFILFLIWWGCNNLFALHAQHILTTNAQVPHLFVDLTLIQIVVGLLMSYVFTQLPAQLTTRTKAETPVSDAFNSMFSPARYTFVRLSIAVFHLSGTLLTNSSYALIGSTSTLVWKLTEPVAAVFLKRILLREQTSTMSLFGMSLVLSGAMLFSAPKMSLHFSPVILANLFIPLRNIFVKRQQYMSGESQSSSSAHTFFLLSLGALPFGVFSLLLKNILFGFQMAPVLPLILNALLYNSYQLASIALLERMDVLTHSLANTFKRFSGIALTAFMSGEQLTVVRFFALVLAAVGFPIHFMAKHKVHIRASCSLPLFLQSVLLLMLVIGTFSKFASLEDFTPQLHISEVMDSMRNNSSTLATSILVSPFTKPQLVPIRNEKESERNSSNEVSELSSNFVIGQLGRYISTTDVYSSEKEALTFPDTNCGNMVWQYGGYMKLVDLTKSDTCNNTHVNCNMVDPSMKNRRMVHYRPAANGFNRKMNVTFSDAFTRLDHEGDAILYVGIGMQYSFKDDESKDDMFNDQKIENTVETFKFTAQAIKFLKRMNDLQIPMFMRGDFTVNASRLAGYQYGLSTGCPSLFINEEIHLGALLEEKYRKIMNTTGKKSLKIAFNLTGRYRLFQWMKLIADQHPGSLFYAQGPEDFRVLRNHNVSFDQVRFYGNIPDWLESLSHMDLSIGPRIHGNMAAIAAGTPAFIVAPDFRVVEMAKRMNVPYMTMYDDRLKNGMDVGEMISKVGFDGHAFDANRCQIAKVYKEHLGKFGIHLSQHVEKISQIC